jgi:hypothetical protein
MSIGVGNSKYRTQFSTYNGVREKLPLEIIAGVSQGRKCTYSLASYTRNLQQWNMHFQIQLELLLHLMEINRRESFICECVATCHRRVELFQKKHLICDWDIIFEELRITLEEQRNFFEDFLGFGLK